MNSCDNFEHPTSEVVFSENIRVNLMHHFRPNNVINLLRIFILLTARDAKGAKNKFFAPFAVTFPTFRTVLIIRMRYV